MPALFPSENVWGPPRASGIVAPLWKRRRPLMGSEPMIGVCGMKRAITLPSAPKFGL
jgi:hypothetical protein